MSQADRRLEQLEKGVNMKSSPSVTQGGDPKALGDAGSKVKSVEKLGFHVRYQGRHG